MVVAIALVLPLLTSGRLKHASRYCAALFIAVFALYLFREYLAIGVGLAAIGTVALLVLRGSLRGRTLGRAILAIGLIGASIFSMQRIGPGFFIKLLNPKPQVVHLFKMGVFHEARGEWGLALEAYEEAVALKKDFAPAYLNMGLLLAYQGNVIQARQALSRFVEIYPHDYSTKALQEIIGILNMTVLGLHTWALSPAMPQLLNMLNVARASFNPLTGHWMVGSSLPEENALLVVKSRSVPEENALLVVKSRSVPEENALLVVKSRSVTSQMFVETIATFRRGFVNTGGGSLLTTIIPSNKPRWRDFLSWIPSAFAAVLFSPYPWDWFDANGRLVLFRCFGGFESFAVLLLLPAACVGGWWLVRSKHTAGSLLVWLFLILTIGIGTTVVNAGTLFRLRLSAIIPLLWMAGVGLDGLLQSWSRRSQEHRSISAPVPEVVSGVPQEQPLTVR